MTPTPSDLSEYSHNYWAADPVDPVHLTCMMPTGLMIDLETQRNYTLEEIKADIWEAAEKYPLFGLLRDKSMYVLCALTGISDFDELTDESRRLSDVRPYFCLFKIIEKQVSTNNNLIKNISSLIGKSITEFSALKNPEVNDFRYKMGVVGEEISNKRLKMTWLEKLYYQYPPRLSNHHDTAKYPTFYIVAKFEIEEVTFSFQITNETTPSRLLEMILVKKTLLDKGAYRPNDYILKVCGQDEYIYGDHPLIKFMYIHDTLSREGIPAVVTQSLHNVDLFQDNIYETPDEDDKKSMSGGGKQTSSTCTLRKKVKHVSSWDIDQVFQCKLTAIGGLNCDCSMEVGVQVGLFHGGKSLCEPKKTVEKYIVAGDEATEWNETLVFDIKVLNIPRMARLCIVVYQHAKGSKSSSSRMRRFKDINKEFYITPLAWVNTTVFDYKNQFKTGDMTLYTWNYAEDTQADELLHPLGTVESNPETDRCAAITLCFNSYNIENTIVYPSEETMIEYATKKTALNHLNRDSAQDTRTIREILTPYYNYDRLNDMHEQERNAIWAKRQDCLNDEPEGLPCLLFCVEWNNRDEVAEITSLLRRWRALPVERALELLDYAYADQAVRRYAVNCLKKVKDDEILLYLLQLVQAMKHESYLMCDLVEFLLDRALHNQRIGHYLFWHLRSEMQVPSVKVRFGLLLEAYLKGSQEHIPALIKQMACLETLREGSELAKRGSKEKGRATLLEFLSHKHTLKTITDLISPLNPGFRCKAVKLDKCKVMDSKMRPLWIVFQNADAHGEDIYLIFKNGDDLRQDMLTLQMLRVMDRIWKSHGLDFRMIPYSCISMEERLGMIEVVLNAETIANIQKEKGMFSATSPFKKGSLFAWLKDHNNTDESLKKAINEFTLSCAGYCVATYVLGVADRHSDNIMVKQSGQLFHIDFGHILGHFKEKFGFRRERVPFVLTHDLVYVINNGRTDKEADEFRKFQQLCEKAFLLLRQHGCLILSLFAMMISTGLPELSCEKDLNYLRETLVLDLSDDDAREHFRSKFSEALANSWKTSLNWASHNFSKNNKQ